jgi:hypothetical protein
MAWEAPRTPFFNELTLLFFGEIAVIVHGLPHLAYSSLVIGKSPKPFVVERFSALFGS